MESSVEIVRKLVQNNLSTAEHFSKLVTLVEQNEKEAYFLINDFIFKLKSASDKELDLRIFCMEVVTAEDRTKSLRTLFVNEKVQQAFLLRLESSVANLKSHLLNLVLLAQRCFRLPDIDAFVKILNDRGFPLENVLSSYLKQNKIFHFLR